MLLVSNHIVIITSCILIEHQTNFCSHMCVTTLTEIHSRTNDWTSRSQSVLCHKLQHCTSPYCHDAFPCLFVANIYNIREN